ncbi:hypothetical protein LTR50_001775 [Elasticomyces elasticus]|nr:hypothetical protein LTR50_001775 [Elasticomyces elasticus]
MLIIKRPTATTVSFTVSTRAPAATFTAKIFYHLLLIVKVSLGLFVLLTSWARCRLLVPTACSGYWTLPDSFLIGTVIGRLASWIVDHVDWRVLLPTVVVVLRAILRKGYTEESLLVIRGLGVQTSTSSPTYLTTSTTRFIPTNTIQDIFIHEAFKGFEVKFYMVIVVEGEEDVVVVFPVRILLRWCVYAGGNG